MNAPSELTSEISPSEASAPFPRPPHTVFTPSPLPMRDLKAWTSHTLFPAGSVVVDGGAYRVLSRRESGGRLLAAGVVGVIGAFASGQALPSEPLSRSGSSGDLKDSAQILQERLTEDDVIEVGRGLANYNSEQISKVKGLNRMPNVLGYADSEEYYCKSKIEDRCNCGGVGENFRISFTPSNHPHHVPQQLDQDLGGHPELAQAVAER
ncbi:hypothetical protein MPER_10208 [Moniliophthora perniciosa FA553]|nr:hypothetical protein MPER_10208 [Moniliophthora perniciosa FA553]